MLLDANLLIYATDNSSPHHRAAAAWLTDLLDGAVRVALPWATLGAFLRITTHPRIMTHPLAPDRAWAYVENWLTLDTVWVPPTTERTALILGRLITSAHVTANLMPDAMLAAQAIEHGLVLATADTDFARFPDLRWINPLHT